MTTFDYKKELKHLYLPPKDKFTFVDVPPMQFLMADGKGNPNTAPEFQTITNALYSLAYGIKFALKPQGVQFTVPPLEGLWWMEDMSQFSLQTKDLWLWTLMIMLPVQITQEMFETAKTQAAKKKDLPALESVRLESYAEGLSVQIMYLGAYADEGPTITAMHEFVHQQGYALRGKHHEIYIGDPRRTAPEKLRTVIRQPVHKL